MRTVSPGVGSCVSLVRTAFANSNHALMDPSSWVAGVGASLGGTPGVVVGSALDSVPSAGVDRGMTDNSLD